MCGAREEREREGELPGKIFSHCTVAAAALIQKLSKPEDASSIAKGDGGKQLKGRPRRETNEIEKNPLPKIGERLNSFVPRRRTEVCRMAAAEGIFREREHALLPLLPTNSRSLSNPNVFAIMSNVRQTGQISERERRERV